MGKLLYLTKAKEKPEGKPRVYFTCHPEDFSPWLSALCRDIFASHDCAVYYKENMTDPGEMDLLDRFNLVVVPVTQKLLDEPNYAMDVEIPDALQRRIPVLPILVETVAENIYADTRKFGSLQYLNRESSDSTEIAYEEKLKKYLESVLLSRELADRVRSAFSARIFLSYRKKDRRYANALMRQIHSYPQCEDVAIWFDEFLTPGESFADNIKKVLAQSDLFALLVTPSILEEPNFVMDEEYPTALECGMQILPVQMQETDQKALRQKYAQLPTCIQAQGSAVGEAVSQRMLCTQDNSPVHKFLVGLAYLDGIDMEVDRQRAVELITGAARAELPEAMEKLIHMYTDGAGVIRDPVAAAQWSSALAEYYFKSIFEKGNADDLSALFEKYGDGYLKETIYRFLLLADCRLDAAAMEKLWCSLTNMGICEYTLLFSAATAMEKHRELTVSRLLMDILEKSVDGIYPPYGPLFWYVPEFKLYESLICTLPRLMRHRGYTKMLALTRDVCWIFGQYHRADQVAQKVDGEMLCSEAKALTGIRRALCRLFYTGEADLTVGGNVYPRCFNPREAVSFLETGSGLLDVMEEPFEDELGLYEHSMFSALGGQWIGIVSAPYNVGVLEEKLARLPGTKLRGLFISNGDALGMDYIACNRSHIEVCYVPENSECLSYRESKWRSNMPLIQDVVRLGKKIFYFRGDAVIPQVKVIGDVFQDCHTLTSAWVSDGVQELWWNAFESCRSLQKVRLPGSLKMAQDYAFCNCRALKDVVLEEGIDTIWASMFYGCVALETIKLPDSVRYINDSAFLGCSALKNIELSANLESIGYGAFADCTALESLMLPPGVECIGKGAFRNCVGMKALYGCPPGYSHEYLGLPWTAELHYRQELHQTLVVPGTELVEKEAYAHRRDFQKLYVETGVVTVEKEAFYDCFAMEEAALPDTVQQLGQRCFRGCSTLKKITLPKQLKVLTEGVFMDCCSLVELHLPEQLEVVEEAAFSGCSALKKLAFSDNLRVLGRKAFYGCKNLTVVSLPDSVQVIEEGAFSGCYGLKELRNCPTGYTAKYLGFQQVIPGDDPDEMGVHQDVKISYRREMALCSVVSVDKKIGESRYAHGRDIGKISFSQELERIERKAFLACASLTELPLPEGVTTLGAEAFRGCLSLETVRIPDSVTTIGDGAFNECTNLKKVELSNKLENLETGVFRDCVSLADITIPGSVQYIADYAFYGCVKLAQVTLTEGLTAICANAFRSCLSLERVVIPDSVVELSNGAFMNCTSLVSVQLPRIWHPADADGWGGSVVWRSVFEGCTALESIAFTEGQEVIARRTCRNCSSLKDLDLPATVNCIERRAFEGCCALEELYIPESVKIIESGAFAGCTGLKVLTLPVQFADQLEDIFTGVDMSGVELHYL